MFPSFAMRETLFPATTFASDKQNMFLQHGRNIPCFRDSWKACFPMFPSFATNGNIFYLATNARSFPGFPAKEKTIWRKKIKRNERSWTDEEIEKLITSYEERKSLWDIKSQEYSNRDQKEWYTMA